MIKSALTTAVFGLALAALSSGAVAQSATPLEDAVRAATLKYKDPAAAVADGYVAMPCVSGPAGGAMGIHFANPPLLEDDVIDVNKPEALIYEPLADGSLELLGVEYIIFSGPTVLMGHLFHFTNAPNRYGLDPFYELHVWAWRHNPDGPFADFNPSVSCSSMNNIGQGMHGH
jgi:hypothetical protein